jgi:hypothetical protein
MGAERGRPLPISCLQYLVEVDEELRTHVGQNCVTYVLTHILMEALGEFGSMKAIRLLSTGLPDALRNLVDNLNPDWWDEAMSDAIEEGNLEFLKLLYNKGYNLHRSNDPEDHPAHHALRCGWLEGLRFVVERSGPPEGWLDCASAVKGGVEMLRYVRELGGVLDGRTTRAAARQGDLEALRFAHACGARWNSRTIAAAVEAGSLPCLEYAHTHGCPTDHDYALAEAPHCANGLAVLRYVCEHMDPTWAAKVLERTARAIVRLARVKVAFLLDWQLVLFLGRKLGAAMPEALAEAVAARKERAAALAGVFWKAEQQTREEERRLLLGKVKVDGVHGKKRRKSTHADVRRVAVCEAMAKLPVELRERIALEAHLIIR